MLLSGLRGSEIHKLVLGRALVASCSGGANSGRRTGTQYVQFVRVNIILRAYRQHIEK